MACRTGGGTGPLWRPMGLHGSREAELGRGRDQGGRGAKLGILSGTEDRKLQEPEQRCPGERTEKGEISRHNSRSVQEARAEPRSGGK